MDRSSTNRVLTQVNAAFRSATPRTVATLLLVWGCQGEITGARTGAPVEGGPMGAGGSASSTVSGGGGAVQGEAGAPPASVGTAGDTSAPPSECESSASPGAPVPMRRLTASQVERTAEDVFGVSVKLEVSDEEVLTFRSNISTSVDTASARGYFDFASAVAASADFTVCEGECLEWLLDDAGRRLFRRALDEDERERYTGLFELGLEDGDELAAATWVAEAMLQSPSFLYLDEVSGSDGVLDDHSLAARLSLLLWGSNPDLTLLAKAESGELSTPEQVETEALRLLRDPKSEAGIREFVDQWFDLGRLDDADTRPDLAELGTETVSALRAEPVRFFARLLQEDGDVTALLTSPITVVTPALEPLYADDIVSSEAGHFELDPKRRGGILSLPGVAAALSHAGRTSPTLRGKTVLTGLLCTPPEPPPANVDTMLPEPATGETTRDRIEQHMTAAVCRSCHLSMDGIGLALEKLDWLGRYREADNGLPIDDRSSFPLGDDEVTVSGASELGMTLAGSSETASCISRQWLRYAVGINESSAADCLVEALSQAATGPGGLERLIVETVRSDWFRLAPEDP
ncbi:MAG TPA: DUF1592 domain-containing protein [Polyangiaceae bacterium]|nr:DUF1592 domain-containing protein [Polyangiaceae bacterium]